MAGDVLLRYGYYRLVVMGEKVVIAQIAEMEKIANKRLVFYLFAYWHDRRWKKFVGATVKIWDLAKNLVSLGHEVVLFLPKYQYISTNTQFKIVEVPFLDIPLLRLISFNFFLSIKLVTHWFGRKPEVVYARRMMSLVPLMYAKIRGACFFYEINDDPYTLGHEERKRLNTVSIRSWFGIKIDEINLKSCQKAVVITEALKKKIIYRCSNLTSNKILLIPSGANTELFRPLKKMECRQILKLDLGKKYIYFAGTLLKHQGINTLISAAPFVKDKFPECDFIITGEGPMKEKWIQTAQRENLAKSFIFTGQVDYETMPFWIGASDICVAPFKYSAGLRSPVKVFDYMACGRPVIASKLKGTTDIFQSSEAIKLVEPENAVALAKAVLELLENEQAAKMMGAKGRELVVSRYNRRNLTKKIIKAAVRC